MKLTLFNGIAHDLSDHLNLQSYSGYWKDLGYPVDTNVLEQKDTFDKSCTTFVKERIPKSFNFKRIKHIRVSMRRSSMRIRVGVTIQVDGKEFSNQIISL
jgi:hypothetical protein